MYIQDLIKLASFDETSSVDTHVEVNVKYKKDEGDLFPDPTHYQCLVASLIYLTTTRPDISYVVHQVSQFMSSPQHIYFAIAHHNICYLIRSPTCGLFFPKDFPLQLMAFSDVDWVGCPDTRRSIISWCFLVVS